MRVNFDSSELPSVQNYREIHYIDNILIYSISKKEHKKHVHKILEAFRKAGLQADIDKCEFYIIEVNYLGLIITSNGICMDPHKVSAVQQ